MSGIIEKAKDAVLKHEDKKAQPGDQVEANADNTANQQVDQVTDQMGLGQDNQAINDVVDSKVNSDIPFGNN